jgi:hypothetical protein
MIKDVKSYLHTVGSRLTKAFSMEAFGTEDQLEFWELSAEHVSRKQTPSFNDIAEWMDLLYKAPVHFVYKMKDGKLMLDFRHVITKNILKTDTGEKAAHNQTPQQKEYVKDFEYQLQNLEKKMEMDDVFRAHGITAHSIGQCEHIPLFDREGEFWGIYCAGPYTKSPDQITPKLSIVGRMLSNWLIRIEEEEQSPQKEYDDKIKNVVSDLGSGKLNAEGIAQIILRYIAHAQNTAVGCVCIFDDAGHSLVTSYGMDEAMAGHFDATDGERLFELKEGKLLTTEKGAAILEESGKEWMAFHFESEQNAGFFLVEKVKITEQLQKTGLFQKIGHSLSTLLDYQKENVAFSEKLMDSYFSMLRTIELSRDKTKHHTPRMVAFVQRFGLLFGLEEEEMDIITQTAKLHDIGYVGAVSIEPGKTMGAELAHPIIGANLIEQLSVHNDVVEGVKTHHEWVNGKGSPGRLTTDSIPWTGKIVGLFEYVVEFIESHQNDASKTDEEWLELLSKGLMERADVEFDMVLIPTAIQLLQALGWDGCVSLGVE